ncbi:HAD family phosphatase [Actinoallomurus spadix]|uniref:HAD family phosphatase n=1 Tax=Actinoallomurus spadix TaxID=79912 RepID=A0ABN0WN86_9ACTN|nr:HAD family phosphatase [Actinoallomurus spadix]MCO5984597.1 HAD family phosphatase [Actinoallomurus spadix]
MTGTVLFDLFGVLAHHQSTEGKYRLARTAGVSGPAFWEAYWALRPSYDRGEVTGPGYWSQVAGALGARFDRRRIAELIEADIATCSAVNETMVALVEELVASGRRIALLSNIPEELAVHYETHHRWLQHFQVRAFSCRIGHAKPEPDAYRWCQNALREDPARILFVDDRQNNIQAAEATGMRGHLFTTPTRLRESLAQWDAARSPS